MSRLILELVELAPPIGGTTANKIVGPAGRNISRS